LIRSAFKRRRWIIAEHTKKNSTGTIESVKPELKIADFFGKAPLTIPNETIRLAEIASYISDSVQETGIDGLARTSLRFSSQGGP
jgi:hypothetical protein